jgi:eukaryotic-like serine/threonine-protein kinase
VSARHLEDAPLKEGDILAGKYRVEKVLGAGGMGIVVAATHLTLGTRVAVKFLLPSTCEKPGAVERFVREARAAARIEGEHVARVTDVATLESGAPYMVMELLRGTDLAAHLKEHGALAVDDAVEYVLQACEAIAEAHAMGIVHRDIKPSNLFLTQRPDGTPLVKVLDFGISKALDTARVSLLPQGITAPNSSFGSPLYMSPEQIASASEVDLRTDLWALGVVLHELVTGKPPFVRDTLPALYMAICHEPAPKIRDARPDAPEALETAVLACLQKKADDRIESVAALARALAPIARPSAHLSIGRIERLASDKSALATTSEPPSAVDENAPTKPAPLAAADGRKTGDPKPWGSTAGRSTGSAPLWPWVALGGVVIAGAVALWLTRETPSAIPPRVASPPTNAATAQESPTVAPPMPVAETARVPEPEAAAAVAPVSSAIPSPAVHANPRLPPVVHGTKKDATAPDPYGLDDRN